MDGTDRINGLTDVIIASAIKVHSRLGPGLLEHAYLKCLVYELEKAGLTAASEMPVALKYEKLIIDAAYRVDLLVDDTVIVEVKAVEKVLPVHHSQLLTYLKLLNKQVGLLLNFNVRILPNGIKRMVNNL
ncbi:MAG TPA: GxxExxY protein [Gemmatimonadales bacterium]|jgi:GxxExxY protein|nr:GxxExxY protein [Gemmatimonadales bacterium]